MITVVWNPHGFHVIQSLPKGIKWTGRYSSENILSQIAALRDVGNHREMIVYADNSGPHVAKYVTEYMDQNSLKRAPHPPYSLDLAPSDFYLDISNINYKAMNSRKDQSLFRLSQKF
jgi:transposase